MTDLTKTEMMQKIAQLESINDQLVSELSHLDQLMRQVGFAQGIESVKSSATEILEQGHVEDLGGFAETG